MNYKPSKNFTLDVLLPDHIRAKLHVHPRIDLSTSVAVAGQKYALRRPDRCTPSAESPGQEVCVDNIAFSLVAWELTASFRALRSIWVQPFLGVSLYRRFGMLSAEKKQLGLDEDRLANGPYFGVRMEWKIPEKKPGSKITP